MSKIKKFWKKLEYWQKGSVIGIIVGLLNSLMVLFAIVGNIRNYNHPLLANIMFNQITNIPLNWATEITYLYGCHTSPCILHSLFYSIIIYVLIGALIGLIIGKIKKK